ncbi:MAG TPA: hypothetical protein P5514_12345 [Bacteroidales bacterium]|nr:hypothetical protein [Saprospiraceae bacterium]HRX97728.1 hypothetical protein [Bacteroidales bacterium]
MDKAGDKHEFFTKVKKYPSLVEYCKFDITSLPKPFYHDLGQVKAILLGADPTNNGVKGNPGLKELDFVFGINSPFEEDFFRLQKANLSDIGLSKDDLYIQNVCRNYFIEQTGGNSHWNQIAEVWLPFLNEELSILPKQISVLATAERIMQVLVGKIQKAEVMYSMQHPPPLYSEKIGRKVYPLYRHWKYRINRWNGYQNMLRNEFKGNL